MDIFVLRYRTAKTFPTLCDAWTAAKTIIGKVTKLNDSLLGQHPKCADSIEGFNQRRHEEVRSPKTDEDFGVLVDYLCELASNLPEPRPMFEAGQTVPLYYQLASDHARIAIVRQGEEFAVILTARFLSDPSWLSAWLSRQFGNAAAYEEPCSQADDVDLKLAMSIIRMI
ncbi:hypothetical protein IJV57_00695 [Candidatus Saccharibacteria bacterium]|nr:hypothetical protein [Candidatus Saccharibacteria bacterium]